MKRYFFSAVMAIAMLASPVYAQNCSSGLTTLTNGTTANATTVNSNFTYLGGCAAPLSTPTFTGIVSAPTLYLGNGTASAPSYAFTSSTNTGLYSSASDTLDLSTNGSQRIDINSSGNIGIGTSASASDGVDFIYNVSSTASQMAGFRIAPSFGGSASVGSLYGNLVYATVAPSAGTWTLVYGNQDEMMFGGSGTATINSLVGEHTFVGISGASPSGTIQAGIGLDISGPSNQASGSPTVTVGDMFGLYVTNQNDTTGFIPVAGAGIAVFSQTGATDNTDIVFGSGSIPSGNYGLYQGDSYQNYLQGKLGIGTATPAQALEVNGEVKVDTFASASATAVCENAGVLSSCSSSIRYKEDVVDAPFGLSDVMQMRPVTFKWKGRDEKDIGLIAEEVAKIDPLFVTYKDGKVEGVKYAQLTAVLVNAVKALKNANDTQAAEIASQTSEIARLQTRMSALERKTGLRAAMNGTPLHPAVYSTSQR